MPGSSPPAEDNAVVLALGTRTDDRLAQLRAGEATSIVLLTATSMGLASCPVTEPLEIAETREEVRTEIFGGGSYPQMLLRVGWAPINADPLPSTPRRELSDFVEWWLIANRTPPKDRPNPVLMATALNEGQMTLDAECADRDLQIDKHKKRWGSRKL